MLLKLVRYDLPGVLVLAAFLNLLYRLAVAGDRERDDEERAREFFSAHGYWPDERPRHDAR